MIEPEDVAWFVHWAELMHRIRAGAAGTESVELTPKDCSVMVRGIDGMANFGRPMK